MKSATAEPATQVNSDAAVNVMLLYVVQVVVAANSLA